MLQRWFLQGFIGNPVAYGHGIGGLASGKADFAFQHRRERFPLREFRQQEMASCVLYYCRFTGHFDGKFTKNDYIYKDETITSTKLKW
jgi:hypothetical protein